MVAIGIVGNVILGLIVQIPLVAAIVFLNRGLRMRSRGLVAVSGLWLIPYAISIVNYLSWLRVVQP